MKRTRPITTWSAWRDTLVCASLAILSAGCARTVRHSGFLGDYGKLAPDPSYKVAEAYRNPVADMSLYSKVIVDPVEIWYHPDAPYKGIQADQLQALATEFREALVKALADRYPVVEDPGAGVMRLRAAITDIAPSKPGMEAVTRVPGVRVLSSAARAVSGTRVAVGEASMEAEITDAESGTRLVAIVDTREGRQRIGKPLGKFTDAQQAFDYWAKTLREQLDRGRLTNYPFP